MKELLDQNREKIGETAYKKAYTAATQLENLYVAVPVELLAVIAYIFSALHEVTPLTLQKLLYYIQGNYAAIYDKPLFDAPCEAWVHGERAAAHPGGQRGGRTGAEYLWYVQRKGSGKHHPQRSPLAGCPEGFSARRNFSCGDFAGCDEELLQKGG